MSDARHRHPYDCIAFLDQRWDAMTAEMRAKAVQVEAELHMRIAALTSELAEARDCGQDAVCAKAPGCQRHWQERNGELVSELAEARRMLAEVRKEWGEDADKLERVEHERDDLRRERDALLDMARDISVYAATSARHGSERSMRDVLTMTASRARSFLLPKRPHKAGEAK